jgi:hypothetical protein
VGQRQGQAVKHLLVLAAIGQCLSRDGVGEELVGGVAGVLTLCLHQARSCGCRLVEWIQRLRQLHGSSTEEKLQHVSTK